jgi:hypothetical protein
MLISVTCLFYTLQVGIHILIFFLANLAKGNMSFCHRLVFRGEDFFKSSNQKQELPVVAMFINGSGQMSNLYRGPSIDASYQVSVRFCHHLVSVVCHPFTFHILIFSSENLQPNELKLGRKHIWKVVSKECTFS